MTIILTADERPNMSDLSRLEGKKGIFIAIPQQVGTYYSSLGYNLLNDHSGAVTRQIIERCLLDGPRIVNEIFYQWRQGQGREPVTWRILIEVLRKIGLSDLATDIESCLCPDGLP